MRTNRLVLSLAVLISSITGTVLAQAPVNPQGPTISSGRSYVFEVCLVLVMFGAALYAVCRSSIRR